MPNEDRAMPVAVVWTTLVVVLCLFAFLWQRHTGVAAQTSAPTPTQLTEPLMSTPTIVSATATTATPTATPTTTSTAIPRTTPTATPTDVVPLLTTEDLRALIRAQIRALLLAVAATPPPEPSLLALPLVQNEGEEAAAAPAVTATPTATPTLLPMPDGVVRTARVPILMYHYLSAPPADADIYRQDLSVTPELFARHLDRLQAEGYTTISLYDLYRHLVEGAPLPEKPVILTFDDGYRDNYTNAFPLLRERNMTATFFVVTDFIDKQRSAYITWEMARAMQVAGMSIESHGRNHVSLEGQDDNYLVWQALGSLETIAYELGVRPRFVSYPAGEYDENTIRIFQSAHYWAGVTTQQGATHHSDDLFQLHRVRVRGTTEPDDLIRLLEVDW